MDENLRYRKDKATVIAIIKYVLYLAITLVVLYFSSKVIAIIFPFLIGFVLAKASRHLAKVVLRLQAFFRKTFVRQPKITASGSPPVEAEAIITISKKKAKHRSKLYYFIFPPKKKRMLSKRSKIAVVIYVVLLVVSLAAMAAAATALVIQARHVMFNFPKWITQSNYVGIVINWISQFSTDKG